MEKGDYSRKAATARRSFQPCARSLTWAPSPSSRDAHLIIPQARSADPFLWVRGSLIRDKPQAVKAYPGLKTKRLWVKLVLSDVNERNIS